MRLRLTLLSALLLVALLTGVTLAPEAASKRAPKAPAKVASDFYGIHVGHLWRDLDSDPAAARAELDAIAETGVSWVRAGLEWRYMEQRPPAPDGQRFYEWEPYDRMVAELARRGLRWQPTMLWAPGWAVDRSVPYGRPCSFNTRPALDAADDYGALFAATAARYGSGGSFWREHPALPYLPVTDAEAWNEANHPWFWCPGPQPEIYARFLAAAIVGARSTDPSMRVLFSGLAPFPESADDHLSYTSFISRTLAPYPVLGEQLEAAAIHPYGADPAQVLERIATWNRSLRRAGARQVRLLASELGWSTGGVAGDFMRAPEPLRARYLGQLARLLPRLDCPIYGMAPHEWTSLEQNPLDIEHFFGLARPGTNALYPAGRAYVNNAALMRGERAKKPPRRLISTCYKRR